MSQLTQSPAWRALQTHVQRLQAQSLRELFSADAGRSRRFTVEACGLTLDYARQRIDVAALEALLALAAERDVAGWTRRLYAGEAVNHTEGRAALHVALRAAPGTGFAACGVPVDDEVQATRQRCLAFAETLRADAGVTDVINIGIGGSDLGPRMVCEALAADGDGPRLHFIANVDPAEREAVLARCRPGSTQVIVTSKTFTTQETMANAGAVRRWLVDALGETAVPAHFAAVTASPERATAYGIAAERVFGFGDWVGGRYSLWSAVGLPIMIAVGRAHFEALLAGAADMDAHFRDAPPARNLPLLMALIGVWNSNGLALPTQVVVPYAQALGRFVPWLQQLEMESNGKGVDRDGQPLTHNSTPALWGDIGSNAQHAFFQMLHQGPTVHPVDFILPLAARGGDAAQQRLLVANCLAQAAALMLGKDAGTVRAELEAQGLAGEALAAAVPHRVFPGNRPSSLLLLPRLDAYHLGALLALYEHRCFALSVLWGVNAFDQWGVELGKQLTGALLRALDGDAAAIDGLDPATAALLPRLRS